MKTNRSLFSQILLVLFSISIGTINAQVNSDFNFRRSKIIHNEVIIDESPDQVWKVLKAYGEVSNYNATIDKSHMLNDGTGDAELGAEREIYIPNGIYNIINKERIVEYVEGVSYTYEVFHTENFPTREMEVTYGIRRNGLGQTILFSRMEYQMNNYLNTRMYKGKLRKSNFDSLLSFKNYIETGKMNKNLKELRKQYSENEIDHTTDFAVR